MTRQLVAGTVHCRKDTHTGRPNTEQLFHYYSPTVSRPEAKSMLEPAGIEELLLNYPYRNTVDTLTGIATYGARIGYKGRATGRTQSANHRSAYVNHTVLDQSIGKEVNSGHVKLLSPFSAR